MLTNRMEPAGSVAESSGSPPGIVSMKSVWGVLHGETNPTFRAEVDVASFNFVFGASYSIEDTFPSPRATKKNECNKQNEVSVSDHCSYVR